VRPRAAAAPAAAPQDDDEDDTDTDAPASARPARTTKLKRPSKKALATLAEERLTLEQAAAVLVPLVASAGEMTMQELEDVTAVARRKLRFHVGQLVKQGYLERRGMGRGTTYAATDAGE
jgi:predicted HTH transcriptional regulator